MDKETTSDEGISVVQVGGFAGGSVGSVAGGLVHGGVIRNVELSEQMKSLIRGVVQQATSLQQLVERLAAFQQGEQWASASKGTEQLANKAVDAPKPAAERAHSPLQEEDGPIAVMAGAFASLASFAMQQYDSGFDEDLAPRMRHPGISLAGFDFSAMATRVEDNRALENDFSSEMRRIAAAVSAAQPCEPPSELLAMRLRFKRGIASYLPGTSSSSAGIESVAEVEMAVARAVREHEELLRSAGVGGDVIGAITSLVDLRLNAQAAVHELELRLALQRALGNDPVEAVGAGELGTMLGVTDETVRTREKAGELFSILRPGRKRGREYAVFQTWDGIRGEPLKRVLRELGNPPGTTAYSFFTTVNDFLGGLTPVEVLTGTAAASTEIPADARAFLVQPEAMRLDTVLQAAAAYAQRAQSE